MKSYNEIEKGVYDIFRTKWEIREGRTVPCAPDVGLGNDAVNLDATVLYADLKASTSMVQRYNPEFAAEVYKSYLFACCEVIRNNGGEITSFDGDRVMAVFIGSSKNTSAAKTALQINYIIEYCINPVIQRTYPKMDYRLEQAVGIDTSKILVARTGIRGDNDLVWVGNAANMAAKMCGIRDDRFSSYITENVYNQLNENALVGDRPLKPMWTKIWWDDQKQYVYASNWLWKID